MSIVLNTTISSYRAEATQDAQGTDVRNWDEADVIDQDVPASIQEMSNSEIFALSRRQIDCDFEIYTNQTLSAKLNDRIEDAAGNLYEVKRPAEDMAGRGRWFCTYAKKLVTA